MNVSIVLDKNNEASCIKSSREAKESMDSED